MIKNVQLMATVPLPGDTRPATPEEIENEACLWSVYVGEPGDFSWLADFAEEIDARAFAELQCGLHAATLMEGQV